MFWECGGTLAAPAIAAGVVHKVLAFIAPKIIGGTRAPTPVGELGFVEMTQVGLQGHNVCCHLHMLTLCARGRVCFAWQASNAPSLIFTKTHVPSPEAQHCQRTSFARTCHTTGCSAAQYTSPQMAFCLLKCNHTFSTICSVWQCFIHPPGCKLINLAPLMTLHTRNHKLEACCNAGG